MRELKKIPIPKEPEIITPDRAIRHPEDYIKLKGKTYGTSIYPNIFTLSSVIYSYPPLLVSMKRKHFGLNWYQAHEALHKEDSFMLNIRQYLDLLILLKSGDVYDGIGNKLDQTRLDILLNDMLERRDPYRAEWLDADFKVIDGVLHINYDHRTINDQLKPQSSKPLGGDCMMEDCYVEPLISADVQGLPIGKSMGREIYYRHPRRNNHSVAKFGASLDEVALVCDATPLDSVAYLGVRVAKIF